MDLMLWCATQRGVKQAGSSSVAWTGPLPEAWDGLANSR